MGVIIFVSHLTKRPSALLKMFYKVLGISKKTGNGTVYVVLRTGKVETVKTTGVSVAPKYFDTKTGKVSKKDILCVEKNAQICAVTAAMERADRTARANGVVATAGTVNDEFARTKKQAVANDAAAANLHQSTNDFHAELIANIEKAEYALAVMKSDLAEIEQLLLLKPAPVLFADKLKEFIRMKELENLRPSSIKNYTLLGTVVARYNSKLLFNDINLSFFQQFQKHLADRGVFNSTSRELIGKFKSVFAYFANREGISTAFLADFKSVKAGEPNEVLFLNATELAEIENLNITTVGQRDIRQQFLFAVETGLRYSDYQIKPGNIKGEDLVVRTTKTGRVVTIPFTNKARKLFVESGGGFRFIREAQFNQGLKALCKKLPSMQVEVIVTHHVGNKVISESFKKWELISSHVARKTYAENALSKGADIMAVAEWLGHKSTKMLETYYANKKQIAKREAYKVRD